MISHTVRLLKTVKLWRLIFLCCAMTVAASHFQASATEIKIATYNVENLFDAYDDPYAADVDRYKGDTLMSKPLAELKALAEVIRALNADVLGLQEVENRGFLEEFNKKYLSGMGYRYVELIEGNDTRGIDVAVLSRIPMGAIVSYRHLPLETSATAGSARFSRDLLQVELRPRNARAFSVYVTHLRSRMGGADSARQREAEAHKIREIWDNRLKSQPQSLFLLLADVNDDPASATVRILKGKGKLAVLPLGARAADGSEWTEQSRFTSRYPPIRFDYIFASPAMGKRVRATGVLRGPKNSSLFRATRSAGDHFPVWAIVDL
ncbi:MAG: endonuclease/exonuclease/phosphatase family protein [Armatimonadetes bacterium]|nr:endonuclease/exonuclease/phosphatase family protein [Armatimonadota bacterium]